MQPAARELRYEDPESAAAEEGLIRLLYLEPALIQSGALPLVSDFSAPALGKIYEILLSRYDLKAEECLFIDDRKVNLEAADTFLDCLETGST